jgi:hypothetical protein
MKLFFTIIILSSGLFACNGNTDNNVKSNASSDSTKVEKAIPDTSGKIIKASAAFTSDSLTQSNTTAGQWKVSGFHKPDEFKKFFIQYKTWIAADNVDSITAHIKFPLRNCKSAADFKKNYSEFFNSKVKNAVTNQDPDKFFVNYDGAMAGDGELWFSEFDGKYYVVAINNKMK